MPGAPSPRLLGAVLAGGRSLRFGTDKAAAELDGKSLLARAADALAPQVDALVVVGRDADGWRCVPDRPAAGLGPLGGLCGALALARADGYGAVVSTACDMPRLPPDLVRRLAGNGPAHVAHMPIVGYWPAALLDALDAFIAEAPKRSMFAWSAHVGARVVEPSAPIPNVNTEHDLVHLRRDPDA